MSCPATFISWMMKATRPNMLVGHLLAHVYTSVGVGLNSNADVDSSVVFTLVFVLVHSKRQEQNE